MSKKRVEHKKEIPFIPVLDEITHTIKIKTNLDPDTLGVMSIVGTKLLKNILSKWIDYFESQVNEDGSAEPVTLIDGKAEGESHHLDYKVLGGYEVEGICKFLRFFTNKMERCPRCKKPVPYLNPRFRDDMDACPNCHTRLDGKKYIEY